MHIIWESAAAPEKMHFYSFLHSKAYETKFDIALK